MPLPIRPKPKSPRIETPPLPAVKPKDLFESVLNQSAVNRHRTNNYSREEYFIHVSDLMQASAERRFCPREHAINYMEARNREMVRSVPPAMELLWKFGNAAQDHITQKFVHGSQYGHTLWGNWSCVCQKSMVRGTLRPAGLCNHCGLPYTVYHEFTIQDRARRITGHPDILILWNNLLHIYEVKTIDRASIDFDTLDAPLGDHTLQTTFYYHMMSRMYERGELPYPVADVTNYIYIDRSNAKLFFGKPYKEFQKKVSAYSRIQPMFENAEVLNEALKGNRLPTKICDTMNCTRAKNCSVQVSCWSRRSDVLDTRNARAGLAMINAPVFRLPSAISAR